MVVICHVNVRSLVAAGRIAELENFTAFNNVDILCITETWLKPKHLDSMLNLPGFQPIFRRDRLSAKGGGGSLYPGWYSSGKTFYTSP